jgi:hypothetical protein
VPEYHWIIYRPGVIRRPLVEIAPANPDIGDFEQNIIITDFGCVEFAYLYRPLLWCKIDYSG